MSPLPEDGEEQRHEPGGRDRPVVDRRYPFPGAMFDARSYPKGAYVLHMLRRKLGDDVFWKGTRTYGVEHKYKSVETSDFRKTMERVSGRNLERFFYDWTERAGSPVLEVNTEYLPDTKLARVTVKQTQPGEAFALPLQALVRRAVVTCAETDSVVAAVRVMQENDVGAVIVVDARSRPSGIFTSREQNVEVLNALKKLTGQNFGFDMRTWHLWWAANQNGATWTDAPSDSGTN